jgi:hypothetical protein
MPAKSTFPCPICGKIVPAKARACPNCGACDKTGWNEQKTATDGLDLPDDDFDYDKFTAEEFGTAQKAKGPALIWKITAVVVLIVTTVYYVTGFLYR